MIQGIVRLYRQAQTGEEKQVLALVAGYVVLEYILLATLVGVGLMAIVLGLATEAYFCPTESHSLVCQLAVPIEAWLAKHQLFFGT